MASIPQSAVAPAPADQSGQELSALLHGAGVAPLDQTGWIRVTGEDRVRWLNGMVTNFTQQLVPGEGCYNFVLNAQGRILGDLTAFAPQRGQPDSFLLETSRDQMSALLDHLNRFIIMDDVELTDLTGRHRSDQRSGILIAGPQAAALLKTLDLPINLPMDPHPSLRLQSASWNGASVELVYAHSPLIPRIELWTNPATIQQLNQEVLAAGATAVSSETLEQLRILEGTPRYGIDIRNSETVRDLPQETGQTRALHFSKGCYLGQEIVERIHSRGNVHRTFTGFSLSGELPAPGAQLLAGAKPVGEITSVASIQLPESAAAAGPLQLALGYIRREALSDAQARGLTIEYPGGVAIPIALPYPVS